MSGKDGGLGPEEGKVSSGSRARGRSGPTQPRPLQRTGDENVGWVIISYLVAGMFFYGGLGWLIGHWIGATQAATLIGLLAGLALAVVLVIYRYGRS